MQLQLDITGAIAIFAILAMLGYVIHAVMKQNERITKFVMRNENPDAFHETQGMYDIIKYANDDVPEEEKSDGKSFFDVYLSGEATDNDEKMFGVKFNKAE